MAYEKLGFVDKVTPLDARHFNYMEEGITAAEAAASEAVNKATEVENKIPQDVVKSVNGATPDETGNVTVKIPDAGVKTVNGNAPDENGNVSVDIPEGFSGSWNDLEDKPFYENNTQLASAHNVQFEAATRGVKYALPIVSEWNGLRSVNVLFDSLEYNLEFKAPIMSNMGSGEPLFYGNASLRKYAYEGNGYYDVIHPEAWEDSGEPFVIEVSYSYGEISRVTVYAPDNMENVHSIEAYIAEIQPLDEKFIPDTIARKTDIPESSGGDVSWNDLKDKPFGVPNRTFSIVPDDVYSGATVTIGDGVYAHKVSDMVLTKGELMGATYKTESLYGGEPSVTNVTTVREFADGCYSASGMVYSVPYADWKGENQYGNVIEFPEAGVYFVEDSSKIVKELRQNYEYSRLSGNDLVPAMPVKNATGEVPTAGEFNALLDTLRKAGFLEWY